jgi:hypothetical protein
MELKILAQPLPSERKNVMHPDHDEYLKYMGRARLDKAVNTLLGILQGISFDSRIDGKEISLLDQWLRENSEFRNCHPFTELIPVLEESLLDECLEKEEYLDLLWICEKLRSTEYYGATTADIQILHGILGGIISDGIITEPELKGLSAWISDHEYLAGCWPYDEIGSLVLGVLADKKIDEQEQRLLNDFFGEFIPGLAPVPAGYSSERGKSITGLCAVCPNVVFPGSIFCFTGSSPQHTRKDFCKIVEDRRGIASKSVNKDINYLVIGSGGNPCWAYACYGRKVEQAIDLRRKGHRLLLVHENDFLDAAAETNDR